MAVTAIATLALVGVKVVAHYLDTENRHERERLVAYDEALGQRVETVTELDAVITSGAPYSQIMAAAKDYNKAQIDYIQAKRDALKIIINNTTKPMGDEMTHVIQGDLTGSLALMDNCLGRAMGDIRQQHTITGRARRQFLVKRSIRTVERCFALPNRETMSVVMADYEVGLCATSFSVNLGASLSRGGRGPIHRGRLQPKVILAVCRPLDAYHVEGQV